MQVAKISSIGQITVPTLIREILNLSEGNKIAHIFEEGNLNQQS